MPLDSVPVTSDLGGYVNFWRFWFSVLIGAVLLIGWTVIALLWAIWYRLGRL